jgi:hypothetical protein
VGKRIRVPAVLTVVTLGAATTIAVMAACSDGDDPPQDSGSCAVYCVGNFTDAGPPPPAEGCPNCAEEQSGMFVCPAGCTPFGG